MSNIDRTPILLDNNFCLNNPQFKRFFDLENLPFKAYSSFNIIALLERQELYDELAKRIWNVKRLSEQLK
ncbi:MAG: hypothetical protein IT265_05740 [Saprospiraceae bacterium]|nr:hypothetical protein [Saprospiraceae bacterium]